MMRWGGFQEEVYSDAMNFEDVEMLPKDCIVECGQINNFMNGHDFYIIDAENEKVHIEANRDLYVAFDYYYNVWDDFTQFKILPHGKGTIHEFPWVLDIIKYFNNVKLSIDFHREHKRR